VELVPDGRKTAGKERQKRQEGWQKEEEVIS